ncbi:TetR/AcrR family transcriptional regulator [Alsobacter sp. R-9]
MPADLAPASTNVGSGARPRRMSAERRRADIVARAAVVFAEHGFGTGTRELAAAIGVTQPLLYRYFPSKDDLVREVYEHVYLRRWDPGWEDMISDRSVALRQRLVAFYEAYTATIFSRDWIRIYLLAGLAGIDLNRRYIGQVEERLLGPIARETRSDLGRPDRPPTASELEHVWLLHGGIFYSGVRVHVFGQTPHVPTAQLVSEAVDTFLAGARRQFAAD